MKSKSRTAYALITISVIWLFFILIIPLGLVFYEAFKGGIRAYFALISAPESMAAIRLTLFTALLVVPINAIIGIALAWLLSRHRFIGKPVMTTLVDLPFAISPVVAGLMMVLLFGAHSLIGGYLQSLGVMIIFAKAGIVLATLFVTLPFVARELLIVMPQSQDTELAALTLGARPWQMFWRITLPSIKWALLYGVLLTAARALGEFGAVSVVSGHIRGKTNTMPLLIEIAYHEYAFDLAFALSSLLALFAIITLLFSSLLEQKQHQQKQHQG